MTHNTPNSIERLTVGHLLSKDKYIIPRYQRNYRWGKVEIDTLLNDLMNFINSSKNYYIGTLVVAKQKEDYEVIDGQQRFTTLSILYACIAHQLNDAINGGITIPLLLQEIMTKKAKRKKKPLDLKKQGLLENKSLIAFL